MKTHSLKENKSRDKKKLFL